MKTVLLTVALASGSLALEWNHEFTSELLAEENLKELFEKWRFEQSKTYDSLAVEMQRFAIFSQNMERIAQSNDDYHNGAHSYLLRMNHFGDLSDEERSALFYPMEERSLDTILIDDSEAIDDVNVEQLGSDWHVDHRDKGRVSSVKSQGGCGSCWDFAATAALECNYAISKSTSPPDMSEQQILDCNDENYGCGGGRADVAFETAIKYGICSEGDYRYEGKQGNCRDCSKHWRPRSYEYIQKQSSSALRNHVTEGCIKVDLQADQFAFGYYSSGVMDGKCGGGDCNHAVLVTGYGVMDGKAYWVVKNSWGDGYGDKGYIYVCRDCGKNGANGQCGMLTWAPEHVKF